MRKNSLKLMLQAGEVVTNGWLHIPNTWSAEVMTNAGWDSVTVDMQHGLHNIETAMQLMQAISTTETIPMARAMWNDPAGIMRLLDMGAYGIICPMINSRSDCEKFVQACKYPPLGYRSSGPTRARVYGGDDYVDHANDEILTMAMIETTEALENLDEILTVAGLDAVFVGSRDLQMSLSSRGKKKPELFDEAINTILIKCNEHHIVPGIWCGSLDQADQMKVLGFKFIALMSDSMILSQQSTLLANQLKSGLKE